MDWRGRRGLVDRVREPLPRRAWGSTGVIREQPRASSATLFRFCGTRELFVPPLTGVFPQTVLFAMTGKRKSTSSAGRAKRKKSTITLEEKLKMIEMCESGQRLSAIAREMGHPLSTVSTIMRDKARILESTRNISVLKSTIITKKRQGPISEMESLLTEWLEDMNRKHAHVSQVRIQEKARSLYEDLKEKAGITEGSFSASHGWLHRYKKRANLHLPVQGVEEEDDVEEDEEQEREAGGPEEAACASLQLKQEQQDEEDIEQVIVGECAALPTKELIEFEALVTAGEREQPPVPAHAFTLDGLAEAFGLVDAALAQIESMDPNMERFEDFSRRIHSDLSIYRDIQQEKKQEQTQCTLDVFIQKRFPFPQEEPQGVQGAGGVATPCAHS
ncbi:tigger transposable element-derived protein 1-like [Arapaima gigas]